MSSEVKKLAEELQKARARSEEIIKMKHVGVTVRESERGRLEIIDRVLPVLLAQPPREVRLICQRCNAWHGINLQYRCCECGGFDFVDVIEQKEVANGQ
jgi:hypothetical protein